MTSIGVTVASLTIRVDPVAVLRKMRGMKDPDPAQMVVLAELAGADAIAMQLRRDRKYLRERDMYILRELVRTRLALELPPVDTLIDKALEVRPWMVTFVNDHADSDTPVSGIDFASAPVDYGEITARFRGAGISTCFLVEPEPELVKGAGKAGASAILINCREYSDARTIDQAQEGLDRIDTAAQAANKAGMRVRAGGGLSYKNIESLVELGNIDEFVVGHAVISRALMVGLTQAVTDLIQIIRSAPQS
ncbi:pyridoxine 5'-phosphate synthase [candidate division GN15 bacterium]|nr:pyridoxine 5'-phosphate synthase [candidate division GN15 bacterium]